MVSRMSRRSPLLPPPPNSKFATLAFALIAALATTTILLGCATKPRPFARTTYEHYGTTSSTSFSGVSTVLGAYLTRPLSPVSLEIHAGEYLELATPTRSPTPYSLLGTSLSRVTPDYEIYASLKAYVPANETPNQRNLEFYGSLTLEIPIP